MGCTPTTPPVEVTVGPTPPATPPPTDIHLVSEPLSALPTPAMEVNLPNYGPAPELTNQVWLNTDHPLRLAELQGRVVLLDFWTFG